MQKPKTFRRAISPAQAESMARMKQTGLAWNELSSASVAAWRAYAKGLVHHNDVTGERYAPAAFNVFSGLFCKLLQIDSAAPVPVHPPFGTFMGDNIIVECGLMIAEDSTIHNPQFEILQFTASAANQPGVLTEILYQRLPGPNRLPKPAYKSAGFASFHTGSLTFTQPVEPGPYACAYHFVEASTGRTTLTMPLGTVTVSI